MKKRIIGIFYLIPIAISFIVGGYLLDGVLLALSFIGLYELNKSLKNIDINISIPILSVITIAFYIKKIFGLTFPLNMIILIFTFLIEGIFIVLKKHSLTDMFGDIFSVVYVVLPFYLIAEFRAIPNSGLNILLTIFLITISTDVFAYLTGKVLGKHKLIPSVSPHKTVEGSIGSIISTVIILSIYAMITKESLLIMIPIAILGNIIAQFGDLFASTIKRATNIKDFGNLIPGHGGIIDRFDSAFFETYFIFMIILTLKYIY